MNWRNTLVLCMSVIILVCVFIWLVFRPTSILCRRITTKSEGFEENNKYTYTPDRDAPNVNIDIYVNYVVDETIKLLEFFKDKRGLVYRPPPALEEPPIQDAEYVDDSDAVLGTAPAPAPVKQESFEDNQPTSHDPESLDPDVNTEYEGKFTMLDLANKYAKFKDSLETELDKMFGMYFKKDAVDEPIFVKFGEACNFYTEEYAYVHYYVVSPTEKYQPSLFLEKWTNLLKTAKTDEELDDLKKTFYDIIGDSFLYTKLIEYYKTNYKMYNKKDDALFLINTGIQHLKRLGSVPTGAGMSDMHADALRLTEVSIIVSELFKLLLEGEKYTHFKYDYPQFVMDYENAPKRPKNSLYLFFVKNPMSSVFE